MWENKLAVFVEGQTEQLFVEKLVLHLAAGKAVHIERHRARGGRRSERYTEMIDVSDPKVDARWLVMIFDCGADSRVKSDIIDRYDSLVAAGYSLIVGLRDVYPEVEFVGLRALRKGLAWAMPTSPVEVLLVLAVMELEAWFIAEYTHFGRINPRLTMRRIKNDLDIDPVDDDLEQLSNPSRDLVNIYWLEKLIYDKSLQRARRTINSLDFEKVTQSVSTRFSDLHMLIGGIQRFFAGRANG